MGLFSQTPYLSTYASHALEIMQFEPFRSLLLGKGEDSVYNYDGERRRRLHQSSIGGFLIRTSFKNHLRYTK